MNALTNVEINQTKEVLFSMFEGLSELSKKAYYESIQQFLRYAVAQRSIHPYQNPLTAFVQYKSFLLEKYDASTANKKMSAVRKFFEHCAAADMITHSQYVAIKAVRNAKEQKPFRTWITVEEAEKLINAPDTSTVIGLRDRVVIFLGLVLMLRREEMTKLQWKQLRKIDGQWLFTDVWGKGNSLEIVQVPNEYMFILEEWSIGDPEEYVVVSVSKSGQRGNSISKDAINDIVNKYAKELGIEATPHTLRRSGATISLDNGSTVREVSKALRHANEHTTEMYLQEKLSLGNSATQNVKLNIK